MFWTGLAIGMLTGATFGVIIMALFIAGRRADEREYIDKYCRECEIFLDPTADASYCLDCNKSKEK